MRELLTNEALDCLANSPGQHLVKYIENSIENIHAVVSM